MGSQMGHFQGPDPWNLGFRGSRSLKSRISRVQIPRIQDLGGSRSLDLGSQTPRSRVPDPYFDPIWGQIWRHSDPEIPYIQAKPCPGGGQIWLIEVTTYVVSLYIPSRARVSRLGSDLTVQIRLVDLPDMSKTVSLVIWEGRRTPNPSHLKQHEIPCPRKDPKMGS